MTDLRRVWPLPTLSALDWTCCLRVNRVGQVWGVRQLMTAVSRLGDGGFWVAVVLACLIHEKADGAAALPLACRAVAVGATCYALYTLLKRRTRRPGPYTVSPEILVRAKPLDVFSFPSGHTMQAVALSVLLIPAYPVLAWLLVPFTVLVAMSRVVVGLHYPSDVAAGAVLGAVVGRLVLAI